MKIILKERGFSLIEVIIALLGSLFLMLAIFFIFNQHHNIAEVQEQVSEINASGRFALNRPLESI